MRKQSTAKKQLSASYLLIFYFIISLFTSCELIPNEKVNVYFCGGQSNAHKLWYESIKSEILKIDPSAIVIYNNHPGDFIRKWYDNGPEYNYIEDINIIKKSIFSIDYDFKGFFWYQGESDACESYYHMYEKRFYGMIGQFKTDIIDDDFLIFMNIIYHSGDKEYYKEMREVQREIINDDNKIFGIDTINYERRDNYDSHLIDSEYIRLGKETALNAIPYLYK